MTGPSGVFFSDRAPFISALRALSVHPCSVLRQFQLYVHGEPVGEFARSFRGFQFNHIPAGVRLDDLDILRNFGFKFSEVQLRLGEEQFPGQIRRLGIVVYLGMARDFSFYSIYVANLEVLAVSFELERTEFRVIDLTCYCNGPAQVRDFGLPDVEILRVGLPLGLNMFSQDGAIVFAERSRLSMSLRRSQPVVSGCLRNECLLPVVRPPWSESLDKAEALRLSSLRFSHPS